MCSQSSLCLSSLLCALCAGVVVLAGYEPREPSVSNVPYSQTAANGSVTHRVFPSDTSISEENLEYFFSEINLQSVPGSLLIGAADTLYLLSHDLSLRSSYEWSIDLSSLASCEQSNSNPMFSCRNHIRVYKTFPSNNTLLLVCGTQGDSAHQCRTLQISSDSLGAPSSTVEPPNGFLSPYPEYPGFGEFLNNDTMDDRFFSAGFPVSGNQFSLSYFSVDSASGSLVVTEQFTNDVNNRWLNYPGTLVDYYRADYPPPVDMFTGETHSDESYRFYFVFLREFSNIDSTFDVIYSRIVRICRNDPGSVGVGTQGDRFFTTYLKARISCSREVPPGRQFTGTIDFEYNNIVSVAFNDEGRYSETTESTRLMYGAFTGPTIGPPGTAICLYSASPDSFRGVFSIFNEDVFNPEGTERQQVLSRCEAGWRSDEDAQNVQVVQNVNQISSDPLLILDGIVVTQMSVESVCVVSSTGLDCIDQDVLFLGTDSGEVLKVVFATNGSSTDPVIAERITLDDPKAVNRLTIEPLDGGERVLFVSTFSRVYRLALERCDRHMTCSDCINSRDPYCLWDTSGAGSCVRNSLTATGSLPAELRQNIHDPESLVQSVCQYPTIEFTTEGVTVSESATSVNLTVQSTVADANGLVEAYTIDGTATGGEDYQSTAVEVTFPAGQSQVTLTFDLTPDTVYEGSELFSVALRPTGAGGVNVGTRSSLTVTITEDDVVVIELMSAGLVVSEGAGYVSLVLTKSIFSTLTSSVSISTTDQEALAGSDYLSVVEVVEFSPEETTVSVLVPVLNDLVLEGTERFTASIGLVADSQGIRIGANNLTSIEITDDDSVSFEFSAGDYSGSEGDCVPVTVSKRGVSVAGLDFTLRLETTVGTADMQDFNTADIDIMVNSSQSQATVCLPTVNDNVFEDDETLTLTLVAVGVVSTLGVGPVTLDPAGVLLVEGLTTATVTIQDNDGLTFMFNTSSLSVNEGIGFVDLAVIRLGDSQLPVTVMLSLLNGTASVSDDFYLPATTLLSLEPSQYSVTQRLYVVDDDIVEPSESVVVELSLPSPNVLSPRTVIGDNSLFTLDILNDDSVSVGFPMGELNVSMSDETVSLPVDLRGLTTLNTTLYIVSEVSTSLAQVQFPASGQVQRSGSVPLLTSSVFGTEDIVTLFLVSNHSFVTLERNNITLTLLRVTTMSPLTTVEPTLVGPVLGDLTVFSSPLDSLVVLVVLVVAIVVLLVAVLVLTCLLCRRRRTDQLLKPPRVEDYPSKKDLSGRAVPGLTLSNNSAFNRGGSSQHLLSLESPASSETFTLGTPTSVQNLSAITEEPSGEIRKVDVSTEGSRDISSPGTELDEDQEASTVL